ncbi:MAG: hypothetical protein HGA85_02385 [Nanoarchaeota archaeon]|nr:hypothetical protein [Nanoarchaeota archaeon]
MTFFHEFKEGFKMFGENIATIVNSILLLVVYFVAVGPTAIVARIAKKQFLDIEKKKNTYWTDLNLSKKTEESYYRQF